MSVAQTPKEYTIRWRLSPIQRRYFESEAKYRTLVGGRRFGKNMVSLASIIDFCLNPDEYKWGRNDPEQVVSWFISPTYNQSKKYGFRKALDMIPERFMREDPKWTTPFEIYFEGGSTLEFYSFDRPKSLDGGGVDDMVIDERGYMDDDVWESNLAPMLLDTDGRAAFVGKAAYTEHFQNAYERGLSAANDLYESFHATSYDNPFIPDARIDELFGDLPERVFNREIMAEFDAGGDFLTRDMLTFVDKADMGPPDREYSWVVTADLGIEANASKARENDTDYWAASIIAHDPQRSQAFLADVTRTRGMTKDQGVQWLSSIMDGVPTNRVGVEDNQAQRWFKQDLQKAGLNAYGITETRSKEERLTYLSVPFANGNIKVVNHDDPEDRDPTQEYDPRWDALVSEWLSFPNGSHDDILDAIEKGLQQINLGGSVEAYGGDAYGRDGGDSSDTWGGMRRG